MKDLTHYFVSPPKSREPDQSGDTETVDVVATVVDDVVDKKVAKRSRVKIKISSRNSETRRCDIVESVDDKIDKTPSPMKRAVDVSLLPETPNAFKLLMTRTKATPTSNTKRKHPEIEGVEGVEKSAEKRPKLLEVNDDADGKKRTKKDWTGTKKAKHRSKSKAVQSENAAPQTAVDLGKETTPKAKTKWTMRVKLQSHSGDDEAEGCNEIVSDDDYIFTPKSKKKLHRTKEAVDIKESKNKNKTEEVKDQEKIAVSDSVLTEKTEKRGNHKTKKIKSTSTNSKEGPNRSSSRNSLANGEKKDSDVCVVDAETRSCSPKIMVEKKLAPLFVRRSKPNPAALEARRTFLQSGIPEIVKKSLISEPKSPCNDSAISSMPFPVVSHVSQTQMDEAPQEISQENFCRLKADRKFDFSVDSTSYKSLSNFQERIIPEFGNSEAEKLVKIERDKFETVLAEVESRCSETRAMWEGICSASENRTPKKSPKKRCKKLKLQRKSDPPVAEDNSDGLNPTWTSKYKPMSAAQVVGNDAATSKLRNWLTGWRLPSQKDDQSSGDEFYSSDCSSSGYDNNQVAVLLGPHGSGKSASVYAIAEELGYRVLEVNASSRRTGKKILTDFQEATKSHRVKRDQATLERKPLQKKVPQNSLILIEDVDLIFEEDEGFVSATYQLAANTRRPIVMTSRDSCPYLYRMAPRQQIIKFRPATGTRVAALLELISLAESGYRLPKPCLDILLRHGDLRQSLLQLQYILLSGAPSISQLDSNPRSTLWQDTQTLVYKPAVKCSKKNKKNLERDSELVDELARKLDNISWVSSLTDVEDPASPPWRRKLNPSLAQMEDFEAYSNSADTGSQIADWLRIASLETCRNEFDNRSTYFVSKSQRSTKSRVKVGIDLALSQAIPSTLEHRSTAVDYLPVIRTLCRIEEERAKTNTKRGRRFFNYLHGLNLASASDNILSEASSIFREKEKSADS